MAQSPATRIYAEDYALARQNGATQQQAREFAAEMEMTRWEAAIFAELERTSSVPAKGR